MDVKKSLTRRVVLDAAIQLADENGLESLTMRKLGLRLNVEAMSLYNHVSNKNDLLIGIADCVVSGFGLPHNCNDWRDSIRPVCEKTRSQLLLRPWAATLVQSLASPTDARLKRTESLIATFCKAGFSLQLAYKAQLAIESYIYGFVVQEARWPFESKDQGEFATNLQGKILTDDYPYLAEMLNSIARTRLIDDAENLTNEYDADFDFGLKLLFDGLETVRLKEVDTITNKSK